MSHEQHSSENTQRLFEKLDEHILLGPADDVALLTGAYVLTAIAEAANSDRDFWRTVTSDRYRKTRSDLLRLAAILRHAAPEVAARDIDAGTAAAANLLLEPKRAASMDFERTRLLANLLEAAHHQRVLIVHA